MSFYFVFKQKSINEIYSIKIIDRIYLKIQTICLSDRNINSKKTIIESKKINVINALNPDLYS